MSSISVFTAIAGAYALVAALPGANFLVVSQVSLTERRCHAVLSATGVAVGAATLSGFALSAGQALASVDAMLWALNLCFILVLGYMGASLLWCSVLAPNMPAPSAISGLSCFRIGLVTAATNPITAAFFLGMAVTPACAGGGCSPLLGASAVFAVALCWFGAVALAFSAERLRRLHLRVRPWLNVVLGGAFLAMAANAYAAM